MRFQTPTLLWLALPWLIGWALFARRQRHALAWVVGHVADRFRSRLSVHSHTTLAWHLRLLALMGLTLIVAGSRPYLPGEAEIEAERARVVLLFDASASMYATDVPGNDPASADDDARHENRFGAAREAASLLIESLPQTSFALASFSGTSAIHTPMSADRGFLFDALRGLEIHGQYQRTGSSLAGALDTIFDFQDPTRPNLQAVILSDGEQPVAEIFGEALEALAGQGVPVHTLAIGTKEGQSRLIYDFRDIVAKKDEPAVLRKYHTRRVDEHLERISKATGGLFEVLAPGSVVRLAEAIEDYESPPARIERTGTGTDLGVYWLLIFLLGFLADGLLIGRRPAHAPIRFEIDRIGNRPRSSTRAAAALLCATILCASACSSSPRARAYRENEQGIALDTLGRHEDARVHYKRAIGYQVRPEVPTFNLARSIHREGDYSEAHDLYQEALKLDPRLPEAFYNDGIALYDWGEAERDPKGCELERTRELWTRSLERFARAVGLTKSTRTTGRMARNNHEHLEAQLAEIERLIAEPPPECLGGGGGGGGDSEDESEGGSGGGGEEDDEAPEEGDQGGGGSAGEPEADGDDPSGSGSQPEDPDEDDQRADGPPPLSSDELDQIRQELERIAQQGREPGKFHRRTLPEQFGEEHWSNPDRIIWW